MSTIIVALITVFSIIIISLIFIYMQSQHLKKKNHKLLFGLKKLGAQHGLSFNRQEELLNKVIGLDGLQRKLLIVEENNDRFDWNIIDLEEVENCTVKKVYDSIKAGSLIRKWIVEYLRTVALRFNFKNDKPSFDLIFYENTINNIYDMPELESKARKWQEMLSKMLTKEPVEKIA
jgi:hypothetical protein